MAHNVEQLLTIMTKLRDPQTGCPWDKAQSFSSIVPFTIEEAYEVADAIERMDMAELPSELGDLLFQVVFYCQLGKEAGLFDFSDVVQQISDKLIRRHPHVFADIDGASSAQVNANWEAIKSQERSERELHSVLDDVPQALPALKRAAKIQKRVARVGFDWDELDPVVAKIHEEVDEVLAEVNAADIDQDKVVDEMGDLLFAVVNLSRHLQVDPEQALRQANRKFERRFRGVEQLAAENNKPLQQHTLAELDRYWEQVKQQEAVKS
ncbi:nucleoside triphosphate pyrophosphohydrolase [Shewanella sp. Scap07]|uniref:nucleoside triphosphate pyrophosphohydrolase n=1 Tax=Shewanella sp. Scap07 TaxID=2589987 RepID=UPI0015C0DDC0|nr:nucleoside triphosphate pyrophosphohydrolase [Shewanella sp. Scap07]QLE84758.1 nucleoside triphosphate pyrophosphohydrolase [Shewanella sp. Scap07]